MLSLIIVIDYLMLKVFYKEYLIKYVYLFDNNVLIQVEIYIYNLDRLNFRKYIHPKKIFVNKSIENFKLTFDALASKINAL
jgi:hypothetical protein